MRRKLLVSAAALLAGMAVASAQNAPSAQGTQQPSGAQSQSTPGGTQQRGGQAQQQPRAQEKQGQTQGQTQQRGQGHQKETTGQAQREPGASGQKEPSKQGQGQAQPQRGQKDHTTGQGSSQTGQSPMQQGQTQQRPQGQSGQTGMQGRSEQGGSAGGNVTLTTEQRTKIRQTVLAGGNVPRANNVNFALSVGTTVPTSVHVVEVPTTLIEIHPEWRGHMYFVVGNEIIIVDRNHRIVAVIAV